MKRRIEKSFKRHLMRGEQRERRSQLDFQNKKKWKSLQKKKEIWLKKSQKLKSQDLLLQTFQMLKVRFYFQASGHPLLSTRKQGLIHLR